MTTYDTWKSTEPEPWQDWPPDEDDRPIGQCDCCQAQPIPLNHGWASGIETFYCDDCGRWPHA